MRNLLIPFALTLAALDSAAAAQHTLPPPAADEILVTGERDRKTQIRQFVDALTPARVQGQLSRFEWSVCPSAMGLDAAKNEAVAARLRSVAKAAGIPTGETNCQPNVFVVVTEDKRAFIELLKKEYPVYFTEMGSEKVRRLARSPGPVAAWHVKGLLNADGVVVPRDDVKGYYISEATNSPSRIAASTRPHFLASVVVVELSALAGLTTTQFADYAAMRAFAQTNPVRLTTVEASTILTLLDAPMNSLVPITMTQWDLAFLQALYASSDNHYANQQRGEMRRILRKDLEKTQKKE